MILQFLVDGNVVKEYQSKFGVVWFCPGPMLGPAQIRVQYRFQRTEKWETLTYSLKESPIRVASATDSSGNDEPVVQYTFEQTTKLEDIVTTTTAGFNTTLDKRVRVAVGYSGT